MDIIGFVLELMSSLMILKLVTTLFILNNLNEGNIAETTLCSAVYKTWLKSMWFRQRIILLFISQCSMDVTLPYYLRSFDHFSETGKH